MTFWNDNRNATSSFSTESSQMVVKKNHRGFLGTGKKMIGKRNSQGLKEFSVYSKSEGGLKGT